jgi:hypothetical protein
MPPVTAELSPPINHILVDFENVQKIDLAVIGSQAVTFTLLVGPRQTKLAVSLVERLLEHAAAVQLVRLASAGRNALDFTLAYYVGRAVAADPTGCFHIVSKDAGYDPLIEHLRSKHIHARRHNDFTTLTISGPVKPPGATPPAAVPKLKAPAKSKAQPPVLEKQAARVLEHLRKHPNNRPKRKATLVRHLLTLVGNKITEADVLALIENLRQAGHLFIGEKGAVTYHL